MATKQQLINQAKLSYNQAKKKGDTAGMNRAHAIAEQLRGNTTQQSKKTPVQTQKISVQTTKLSTNQSTIKKAQADYEIAKKQGNKKGMDAAHAVADKARGYKTYTVTAPTKSGYAQKPIEPKDNYAYLNLKAPKLPVKNTVKAPTPVSTVAKQSSLRFGVNPTAPKSEKDKAAEVNRQKLIKETRNSATAKGIASFVGSFSPVKAKFDPEVQKILDKKKMSKQLPQSLTRYSNVKYGNAPKPKLKKNTAVTVGETLGTAAQFAIPYSGLGGGAVKLTSKIAPKAIPVLGEIAAKGAQKIAPEIGELAAKKFGTKAAESLVKDIAIGTPLNVNYAVNKEGLRGKEALKSIAKNTAIDLVTGGILEAAPLVLKSGKRVGSKAEFDKLPAKEKKESMSELERLAYESNVRKGKITHTKDTIYGNSFNKTSGELPIPKETNHVVKEDGFEKWRKENFGGAFGKVSQDDMNALIELYHETTLPNYKAASGQREVPRTVTKNELANTPNANPKTVTQATNLTVEPQKIDLGINIPKEPTLTGNTYKNDKTKYATEPIVDKTNPLKKAYTNLVDNQFALSDSTKGIKQTADKDIKILGSNARNVRGTAEYVFRNNLVDMEGKKAGENSLENLLNTTKGEQEAYADYLLNKHNIARYKQKKPIFGGDGANPPITDKMSEQAVKEYEKQYPHFKEKSKQLNEFNGKFIDEWLVKSGLIDKKFGNLLKTMYPDYVPTMRETPSIKGQLFKPKGLKASSGIKTATGGNDPIMAINKSYPIMIQKAMKAARINELYNGLLDTVLENPEKMSKWAKIADDGAEKSTLDHNLMEMATRAIDDNGIDGIETLAKKQLEIDERTGKYYVTAMKNGKPVRMQVHKDLFDGLNSLNDIRNEGVLDNMANAVGKYATNPFKALITGYNPFFALRNISRDLPTSYIQGTENNPLKWATNLGKAGYHMAKKDDVYNEYLALGGKMNGFFNSEKGLVPTKLPTKILRKTGDVISAFNEATETIPRFGEYLGTVKREGGDYAAKQKGIYNQGEVTVNFGRHGDVTKAIDRITPYLNPSVQGIDKTFRSLKKGSTWAKAVGTVTAPTAAIYALNHRTPEDAKNYAELDNRTKDTYFVFPTGDGKYIKIPKSREMGVIFSTLGERLLRAKNGDGEAFKDFGNTVATNFSPSNPIENNIISPLAYYLPRNKDFANREIVPMSMTDEGYGDARSKYLQYDDSTSELSKWLGNAMRKTGINNGEGLSPKQIDYIIDSYTGIIGDVLLPATTKGQSPTQKVLTKPFTADKLYNNSIQSDFYEKFDEAKRVKSDNNLVNDIPSDWKTPEEKRLSVYTEASIEMSKLRKQEKKIMASSADQKTKEPQLRQIRQQILDIAKRTPANAEKAYQEYKSNYIPEVSMLSKKQRKNYDAIKDKVTPKEFADGYKAQKIYKSDVAKSMALLPKAKSQEILKSMDISNKSIVRGQRLLNSGITADEYTRIRKEANADGQTLKKVEMLKYLKNSNYTREQKMAILMSL